ncbi:DUF5680 domain-containing protein [Desulfovibrio oxyclinae]|uniref:DUF5680 domain-containing protein n=1 Tax=Desulfovibrio oxyclinae TaxID=63560 RepID=UPI0003736015|nr:DUF5680 domain-containing protein [Desulfovibrio oxyclinae]
MQLNEFLVKARKAAGEATLSERTEIPSGGNEFRFEDGEMTLVEHRFGHRSLDGRMIIYRDDIPVWAMSYHGRVLTSIPEPDEIHAFLQKALAAFTDSQPLRGPDYIADGNWSYEQDTEGDLNAFQGEESVFFKGIRCFSLQFLGGVID